MATRSQQLHWATGDNQQATAPSSAPPPHTHIQAPGPMEYHNVSQNRCTAPGIEGRRAGVRESTRAHPGYNSSTQPTPDATPKTPHPRRKHTLPLALTTLSTLRDSTSGNSASERAGGGKVRGGDQGITKDHIRCSDSRGLQLTNALRGLQCTHDPCNSLSIFSCMVPVASRSNRNTTAPRSRTAWWGKGKPRRPTQGRPAKAWTTATTHRPPYPTNTLPAATLAQQQRCLRGDHAADPLQPQEDC
jgi:hypothetical protein